MLLTINPLNFKEQRKNVRVKTDIKEILCLKACIKSRSRLLEILVQVDIHQKQ